MRDFGEESMPGWKTPAMGQSQDNGVFRSVNKITDCIEELKKRLRPEDSLLDVGCFNGHLYGYLGHENYTGVDLYHEHIEKAKQLYPQANFICSDLHDLKGTWDVVWCCRVLIHIPDFEKAARKLLSLARRFLILVVKVGEIDELEKHDAAGEGRVRPWSYFRTFSAETLRAIGDCEIIDGLRYSTVVYVR